MTRVAVVGVGNMGLGIALRLRDQGHDVTVRDIDPVREALALAGGCTVSATPAAAAAGRELVIVVVVDATQTRDVLFGTDGAAAQLARGSTVVLCPTIAPADVESCAQQLATLGLDTIDAPMSGGPVRAREGRMSLMVAAADPVWARWQPLLAQMADPLFRVGARLGDGARTKLVNNLLAAANLGAASEALALAEHLGLDAHMTLDVIGQSSGQSWIGTDRMTRALAGDTEPRARMALLAKDSGLAMTMAEQAGVRPAIGAQAAALLRMACEAGLTDADDSALLRLLRDRRQAS